MIEERNRKKKQGLKAKDEGRIGCFDGKYPASDNSMSVK